MRAKGCFTREEYMSGRNLNAIEEIACFLKHKVTATLRIFL